MKSIKVFALVLTMFILSGCGKEVEVHNTETSVASETKVEETKQETEQETEVNLASESNVTAQTQEETETSIVVESKTESKEEVIDPNFNGAGYKGTLQETAQSYITYEDIEPTVMYVISGNKDESYAIYNDPNVTEGALMMGGLVEPNQELTVDGKATYNEVDYYRLAYTEGSMTTIQYIIPAEYLSTEKPVEQQPTTETQQPSVETQKPVETQPETTTPEQSTTTTPEVPTYDPNCGISEADWNKLYGGGTSGGGINWQPDNSYEFSAEELEKLGNLIVH